MKTDRPIRVGIFRSRAEAQRAVDEARRAGFTNVRILTDDREVRRDPSEIPGHVSDVAARPLSRAVKALPLEGMVTGLLLGFVAAWVLGMTGAFDLTLGFLVVPLAGLIFGGLIGAMLTRGFTTEPDDFFDQEVPRGSVLVAIEDFDPTRLVIAEQILAGAGAEPIPLNEG